MSEPTKNPIDIDDIPMPEEVDKTDIEDKLEAPVAFKFAFVGVGQGGSRICETFYQMGYRRVAAINTTAKDLAHIDIPTSSKLVIKSGSGGTAETEGAGKNPEVAELAIKEQSEEVYDHLRRCWGQSYDWAFICLGAGGGTGAGSMSRTLEIATKVMTDLKLAAHIGVIVALPKNDEGAKVAVNSIATIQRLKSYHDVSPIIVIDNERIKAIYPRTPVNQFWQTANKGVCTLLHLFNQIAAQPSPHTTFDPADMSTLLSSGVVAFGATTLKSYETQADISATIRKQLQSNILAAVDLNKGKRAGCIFVGGQSILDTIPMEYLDHGFEMLTRILADGSVVHRGIYVGSKPDLRVYTMIGELPFPDQRLQELEKIK